MLADNCYPGASKLNVTFITVLNISTDLYLMAIPLPVRLSGFLTLAMGIVPTSQKDSKGSFPLKHLGRSKESKRTVERSHTRSGKKSRVLHPLSIPNDTAWGSDDAIITLDKDTDEIAEGDKDGIVALGVISEASVGSLMSERMSRSGEKRSSSLSPGEILIVREWITMEEQAVPGLDRREAQVETAGWDGMQGSVVKLEDVRRDEAVA
ncbi:hypothetical protein J1614_010789 [Plenodomus biglobosus]|nr:hypothetical protein J1614_010789 [Plenodomus biglobosus]